MTATPGFVQYVRVDGDFPQRQPVIDEDEPPMTANERDIGALLEAVKTLKEIVLRQERENRELRDEIAEARDEFRAFKAEFEKMLAEFRGGSKAVRFLGYVGATIIGALAASVKAWGPLFLSMLPK